MIPGMKNILYERGYLTSQCFLCEPVWFFGRWLVAYDGATLCKISKSGLKYFTILSRPEWLLWKIP